MENKIDIHFLKENITEQLDFQQPDLSVLIKQIIRNNLLVDSENIEISTKIENFDCEEFKEILVGVHEEFQQEIEDFYNNIKKEIKTYYETDELAEIIIKRLQGNEDK